MAPKDMEDTFCRLFEWAEPELDDETGETFSFFFLVEGVGC